MVKLFSKNSNLCDHNSPTLQTDRQTTCDRNTALCTKVHRAVKTSVTHLLEQLQLESLEERRKAQRLAFMYKILNGQVAVPAASVDLILSSRPTRGTDANHQKLITDTAEVTIND